MKTNNSKKKYDNFKTNYIYCQEMLKNEDSMRHIGTMLIEAWKRVKANKGSRS